MRANEAAFGFSSVVFLVVGCVVGDVRSLEYLFSSLSESGQGLGSHPGPHVAGMPTSTQRGRNADRAAFVPVRCRGAL